MSKIHTCINTATTFDGRGPPPCEACTAMPRCSHGFRSRIDKCDSCALARADAVIADARRVVECFTGTGAQMILSAPGRTLEDRVEDLRASLAMADKLGAYASAATST